MTGLTHMDECGAARMVHVAHKPITVRRAVAVGFVRCSETLLERIEGQDIAKGSVFQIARLAGIQAAKRTDELIPLCHSLPLEGVRVDLAAQPRGIMIRAEVQASWKTGVEMEALTAVTVAALTVIDMGKAIDKAMVIENVRLLEKSGGRSGDFHAEEHQP